MNKKTLLKLEYNKIIEKLGKCCGSSMGRNQAENLVPEYNIETVKRWQAETTEAREIITHKGQVPLGGILDLKSILHKVKIGGIVSPDGLLNIVTLLEATKKLEKFCSELEDKYEIIKGNGANLVPLPKIVSSINACISPDGQVLDSASPNLNLIRKQIKSKQIELKQKLEQIVRSTTYQKYLQEPIVTIRNERQVVPVKQEYRANVPGILHDQSASGATLFIEPMAVVDINNRMRQLKISEEKEIEKVLLELTQLVEGDLSTISNNMEILAKLDFIFAKGKLSQSFKAVEPKLNEQGIVNIIQGRHPLIEDEVVPIDISIGEKFDTLVITGPNTGGKTVSLKTMGLFTCMSQAGLHIPAAEESELTIFYKIFVDIGDEQSIEQSLSTFSSHMTNIIGIHNQVDDKSLVLLDELGAGTDPTEGAALAMAILEHFHSKGAKTIATTHYSELKAYAYSNERIENASVEFDSTTLEPTYNLLIGVPGRSNAFEISTRLGLNTAVVARAREFVSKEEVKVADLIKNLEENQLVSEKERFEAEKIKGRLNEQLEELREKEERLKQKEDSVIREAHLEANSILSEAKREANAIIKELKLIKAKGAEEQKKLALQAKEKIGEFQGEHLKKSEAKQPKAKANKVPKKVRPGDLVYLPKYHQKGEVLTAPKADGEVQVQAGILKLNVKLNELELIEEDKKEQGSVSTKGLVRAKAMNIKNEVDIRGYKADQAIYEIDKYLDDAFVAGVPVVSIIHGKGTGALRQVITDLLKDHPHVKSFRLGEQGEGGSGVTVINFK